MPKQAYVRTKPHLNIATMGHTGHGKTTLTTAITRLLGTRPAPRRPGTAPVPHVAYETGTRHYAHADLPGGADRVKHMIAATAGLDGAILVVSALDGIGPRTAEHLLLARQSGVRHLVVALSKADAGGPELTELVELDTRALLTAHGYDGAHTPVVRVSALRALDGDPRWTGTIEALLDAVDTYVPTPRRRTDEPLLLPVERVFTLTGRGTAVAGAIERGTVRPGAAVDIVGRPGGPRRAEVTGLETFGEPMAGARAGDSVALLLRGVERHEVHRGDVVAVPGSVLPRRRFRARVRLLSAAEGGRSRPLATGCRAQLHFRTADVPGTVDLGPHGSALPGRPLTLTVTLDRPAPLERGVPLTLREAGRTIGVGEVV
ncbi:GTP-binding protein [Streptomyces sp. NPDC051162]|uniref:GTP-binding protein n=1 Tax=Streptomyces sp. NPDC051162 TaxID=3154747 RepID=UPI00343A3158